jgi:hypothetical protein
MQDLPVGFVWYRLHLRLPAFRPSMGLDLALPENAYEVFINGKPADNARIGSPLTFYFPVQRFVPLPDGVQDMEIAVRARSTKYYRTSYGKSDPFLGAWVAPAGAARTYAELTRINMLAGKQYGILPGITLDLFVLLGALAVLALFLAQRTVEYLWLSIYLALIALSDIFYTAAFHFLLPYSLNSCFADPVIFLYLAVQIEFTFAFAHRRLSRAWRTFQACLAFMTVAGLVCNNLDIFPITYIGVQAVLQLFVSLAIPVSLLLWFRRGNRKAGWLILPSFINLPGAVLDAGWVAGRLNLVPNDSMQSLIGFEVGPLQVTTAAAMNFLYLVAIGVVLFFRYTRVTREQTRAAAELEAAREIQSRLVPMELPEIEGCSVKAAYVPAAEVGGDFFQVLRHDDGSVLIAVGDVSGKGLRAAMTGALAIGALRTLADEGMGPADLLAALNRQLLRAAQGGFVTMLCARLAPDGLLTLANAGHLFPYRNGEETAVSTGMPLGITADAAYDETSFRLHPGDAITFLSDGVVEARKPDGELLGFDRAQALSARPPEQIAQAAQDFGQEDDITVLSLAFVPAGA